MGSGNDDEAASHVDQSLVAPSGELFVDALGRQAIDERIAGLFFEDVVGRFRFILGGGLVLGADGGRGSRSR